MSIVLQSLEPFWHKKVLLCKFKVHVNGTIDANDKSFENVFDNNANNF